jgi:hypothetical protein
MPRFKVLCGKLTFYAAKQPYQAQSKVLPSKVRFSAAKQGSQAKNKVLSPKTRFSAAKKPSLPLGRLLCDKPAFPGWQRANGSAGSPVEESAGAVGASWFIDNLEGWRPPCPRPPPSRAWRPVVGEGTGRAGGARRRFRAPPEPGILERLSDEPSEWRIKPDPHAWDRRRPAGEAAETDGAIAERRHDGPNKTRPARVYLEGAVVF